MHKIRYNESTYGLRSQHFCFVDFTIMSASVKSLLSSFALASRVAFSTSVWLVSPSLTMKPPFVPILVITIVVSLMRELRLAGDDIIYSAYRQKFDFSPLPNVRHRTGATLRHFCLPFDSVSSLLLYCRASLSRGNGYPLRFTATDVFTKRVRLSSSIEQIDLFRVTVCK